MPFSLTNQIAGFQKLTNQKTPEVFSDWLIQISSSLIGQSKRSLLLDKKEPKSDWLFKTKLIFLASDWSILKTKEKLPFNPVCIDYHGNFSGIRDLEVSNPDPYLKNYLVFFFGVVLSIAFFKFGGFNGFFRCCLLNWSCLTIETCVFF